MPKAGFVAEIPQMQEMGLPDFHQLASNLLWVY